MRIVVAGAGGFIGGHLVPALRSAGHVVTTLVRRSPRAADEVAWDPGAGVLPGSALDRADAVVNLCGAGVGDRRWSTARKAVLRTSRLNPTALLASACARRGVPVLVNASAVGYYGARGDEEITEAEPAGDGFLARLCVDWEAAAATAASADVRVVHLRTGLVIGPDGGVLPRLALLTRILLGGRMGSGRQYWPWVSIVDHVSAVAFLCRTELHGAVNVTAPNPVTNGEFTAELGRVLHRPTPWVIPSPALYAALGGFAHEVVTGQRAVPAALTAAGFRFLQPDLGTALRAWAR